MSDSSSTWDCLMFPISPISNTSSLDELFEDLMFNPLEVPFRPTLNVNTNLTYRPFLPDADQLESPIQVDGGERDMTVSSHYSHPSELEMADPADLRGFAGSPVSPFSYSDWIETATPPESQLSPFSDTGMFEDGIFDPNFSFAPSSKPVDAMSLHSPMSGSPFMGASEGSVFSEVFPIPPPPIETVQPVFTAVPDGFDTELPPLNFTFQPEIDLGAPWEASCFQPEPDLPAETESVSDQAPSERPWPPESDIGDGQDFDPGWVPSIEDFESAFPSPPFFPGNDTLMFPPPKVKKPNEKRLYEGFVRQQAAARPFSQESFEENERKLEARRLVREQRADRAKEKMHARRANLAQLPRLEAPYTAPQHFAPVPRGPVVTHRRIPSQHLKSMPKARPWKVGFRVPQNNDSVWYQVTSAGGDVIGYLPRHEPVAPPSFGPVPNPPPMIPRQSPPQTGPVLLVPARMPAGRSPKRPAEQVFGKPPKKILIDGVAYERR
ncbi:hypothetical protein H2200_006018 [Cladophialophora chaetospira]|uniref:Uncharacterized protein n=1 Tax=Cladophialophora chaetospira TaxID=386627 RepID=A0AA39CIW5_9EURO|nr:hypothetical protein H2200_006018 [Cladophialophora chaetospira]